RLCRCGTSASAGPLAASAPARPERGRAHGRRDDRTRLLRWHRGPGGDRTGPRSRSRFREHLSRPGPGGRLRGLLGRPRLPRTPVARGPGPGRHRRAGPSDPLFYAMTGGDIDETCADAPAEAVAAGEELSEWFRTQPESGADADLDAFRAAWQQLAGACAEVSDAAAWTVEPGDDGTKPATLVCAQTFDTPGTLTHF